MEATYFVLFALLHFANATIHVDQSGERAVCSGGSITITFTHPTLGGDSGYLPSIIWIRNGIEYPPDGLFEDFSTTANKTNLTITCGGDFPFGTTYQASIANQITKSEEFSENITIIAKVPDKVNLRKPVTSLTAITVFWDPVSSVCDSVTYNVSCFSNNGNHEEDTEEGNQYTFTNLTASTTYTVQVNSCYGTHCSDPQEMTLRTEPSDALGINKKIFWLPMIMATPVVYFLYLAT